jgi:hypothetical protein
VKRPTVLERAVAEGIPCPETTIKQLREENARLRATMELLKEVPSEGQALTHDQRVRNYLIEKALEVTP